MPRSRALRSPAALFSLIALSIAIVELAIVRSAVFARNRDIAAWGVTFDLTITIPLLYWFVLVRPGHARPVSLAPVFVVCTSAAALILPRTDQAFLHQLRWLAAPLEVLTLGLLVAAVWRRKPSGARERIAGGILTTEVAILYYALFSWRSEPEVPADAVAISTHKRSGWGTIVVCFIVIIAFESVGLHLFVQHWSVKWAWVFTALDVYTVLWLLGDYQALRLRPTLIREHEIDLRHGMRLNATIDRANVAAVEPITNEAQWKRKGTAKLALLDEPKYLIRLREPVVADSLAGVKRKIDAIAILPDDVAAFERALTLH